MYSVKFYTNEKGDCPIKEFFQELVNEGREKELVTIRTKINLLVEYGYKLPSISTNHAKHIEGKLYELRPGCNRILYFYYDYDTYVLLHAFAKKTNKTPKQEIERAKKEIEDYERMNRHGRKEKH